MNAGKYKYWISIYNAEITKVNGFQKVERGSLVLKCKADIKTTKGFTLIVNDTDFEKATTNFTIRFPRTTKLNRDMLIEFRDKLYTIEYMNNVNEACVELEMQCKEITH